MKANGVFITLLVGGAGDGLLPLATGPDMSLSTGGFAPDNGLLALILNAICPTQGSSTANQGSTTTLGTPGPVATTSSTVAGTITTDSPTVTSEITTGTISTPPSVSSSSVGTTGVPTTTAAAATTTTTAPICTKDLILLLDDSNAIPNQDNFNQVRKGETTETKVFQLKNWVISTFLSQLQSFIQVDPISFDDKMYQEIAGGFLPGNIVGLPMKDMYLYQSKSDPNITK